jgi:hypothetical protein
LLYLTFDWSKLALLPERLTPDALILLTCAVAVLALQLLVSAARWRVIAHDCGIALNFATATRLTFISAFFGQLLLPTVGADVARIWFAVRGGAALRPSACSVFVDRAVGLLLLTIVVAACLPWSLQIIRSFAGQAGLLLLTAGMTAGCIVFLTLPFIFRLAAPPWNLILFVADIASTTLGTLLRAGRLATVVVTSVAIYAMTVFAAWIIARAIGAPLNLLPALIIIPPVVLIAAVPISIAGWGVREGAMMLAFGYAGLNQYDGVLVSVLFGFASLAVGLLGGVAWIFSPSRPASGTVRHSPPAA